MKFLIIAATYSEIAPFMEHFKLSNRVFSEAGNFDVLITGVGMTATAFYLGQYGVKDYDLLINVGIAGSFLTSLPIGSVVCVNEDHFSELGAENNDSFLTIENLGFGQSIYNSKEVVDLPIVRAITVNTVHGNDTTIQHIKNRLKPDIESMEGAAVFFAAQKLQKSAIQIRCISNYVEVRNKANWNIPLAIQNLNEWLLNYIQIKL